MSAGGVRALLWSVLLCSLIILIITVTMAQQRVPCWLVPNGSNVTTQCANGYWQTITPDGEVFTGNGMPDPNERAQGSNIVINPGSGGPTGQVTPPTQQLPMLAPHQAESFGFQPRLE